MIQVQH